MARTPVNRTPLDPRRRSVAACRCAPSCPGARARPPRRAGLRPTRPAPSSTPSSTGPGTRRRPAPEKLEEACRRAARDSDGFVWIGLHEPTAEQLEQLGPVFGLHPLALEDAANTKQRPKIERFDDMLFLAMRTLAYVESDERAEGGNVVETGSVIVFLRERALISSGTAGTPGCLGCAARLEKTPDMLGLGPSSVCTPSPTRSFDDCLGRRRRRDEDIRRSR